MMKYVDTHCHLDMVMEKGPHLAPFSVQKSQLPVNCEKLLHICCHPQGIDWALELIQMEEMVYGAFGVHPHDAQLYSDQIHHQLLEAMKDPKTVAWGEIGLDYFYEMSPRELQIPVFERQLLTAQQLGLPIVLHTRAADSDTLSILRANLDPTTKIHVHCFTGEIAFAQELLSLSDQIYFGFTGIVTFKNAENVRESLRGIPLERLLLETDAPFLAPVPYRGKVAHSGMIPEIVQAIAAIKNTTETAIYRHARKNTLDVYGI